MNHFDLVAHRGVTDHAPENTLRAFQRAIELGADAVELDVRLTSDFVPVVFHYYYLNMVSQLAGPIFNFTLAELNRVRVNSRSDPEISEPIPIFREVMDVLAGRIGMEIEIKGPEPECVALIAGILQDYRKFWDGIEVTSYEPAFLQEIKKHCPGMITDLLFPRSEPWMKSDVVAYQALHHSRLAGARAVHLHPTQLTTDGAAYIRKNGIEIHAWDVNDEDTLQTCIEHKIPRVCTDRYQLAAGFRERLDP
jgi:glycerophosphoryl diester phosphodiesterase